jgi:DNA polymerase-3 subunit epsilon
MPIEYGAWCPICGFRHNRPSGQTEHPREKACEACGEIKPLSAYHRSNGSWNGHQKVCVQCAAAQKAQIDSRKANEKAIDEAKPTARFQKNVRDTDTTGGRYGSFAEMTAEQIALWALGALRRPTLRIVDTETTGRGPRWGGGVDELVEICIIDGRGVVLLNTMVKPRGTMHPDAAAISGITDAMLATCVPFSAIAEQVRDHLNGKHVVIYNEEYDTGLIATTFRACGQVAPTFQSRCAMLAYHKYSGRPAWNKWARLDEACKAEGITPHGNAHRALGDCLSTLALLRRMAEHAHPPVTRPVAPS